MLVVSRWWSGRTGVEWLDLSTRWQLYLLIAAEPAVVLLVVLSEPRVPPWAAAALLTAAMAHTSACLVLLRAGINRLLDAGRPVGRLVAVAGTLTVVVLAALVAFSYPLRAARGGVPGAAVALAFCTALTVAATPMLPVRRLLLAIALPTVAAGVLQVALDKPGLPVWPVNYLFTVGLLALSSRWSVWFLTVMWELDRAKDVRAQLAVAEERLRFARDLHDVLGRNLALITVNSELAARLVRSDPDGAVEHMLAVRQTAQDSMRDVREVVGGYRTADLDAEIAGARAVLRSAGASVQVIGDGAALASDAQTSFGWVVREATTNIIRHSDPTAVRIQLDVEHDPDTGAAAVLRIENDGVRPSHGAVPGRDAGAATGTGLVGLRERLLNVGGDLTAGAVAPARFQLRARLPLADAPPAPAKRPEPVT